MHQPSVDFMSVFSRAQWEGRAHWCDGENDCEFHAMGPCGLCVEGGLCRVQRQHFLFCSAAICPSKEPFLCYGWHPYSVVFAGLLLHVLASVLHALSAVYSECF